MATTTSCALSSGWNGFNSALNQASEWLLFHICKHGSSWGFELRTSHPQLNLVWYCCSKFVGNFTVIAPLWLLLCIEDCELTIWPQEMLISMWQQVTISIPQDPIAWKIYTIICIGSTEGHSSLIWIFYFTIQHFETNKPVQELTLESGSQILGIEGWHSHQIQRCTDCCWKVFGQVVHVLWKKSRGDHSVHILWCECRNYCILHRITILAHSITLCKWYFH